MSPKPDPRIRRADDAERAKSRLARIGVTRETGAGAEATPEERPRSIVALDADPRSRALAEEILTAAGYRVASTGDPRTALRMARDEGPDLVLTDIGMAVMDVVPRWERRRSDPDPAKAVPPIAEGYAVLRAFQVDPFAARFPAVYLKEGETADRAQAYRFGIVDYVPKPIDRKMLLERVEEVFHALEASQEGPLSRPSPAAPAPSTVQAGPRLPEPITRPLRWPSVGSASGADLPAPGFEALPRGLRNALVVDPADDTRRFVRELLSPHGFVVHEAPDGEEGLRVALARRPWLITAEVNMPGMDGFEFCRRVRSHALIRHTPLIFLSGWDDYRERYLGLKLGADDYLSKGTPVREVLIRVQLILKRYSDLGTRTRKGAGLEGGLALVGAPGMLQMCHLGRFTGVCAVTSGTRRTQIWFREGEILSAESGRWRDAEAIFEFLAWTEGHFEFVPGDPGQGTPLPEAFDFLLLEGCRRLDEERRVSDADDAGAVNAKAGN